MLPDYREENCTNLETKRILPREIKSIKTDVANMNTSVQTLTSEVVICFDTVKLIGFTSEGSFTASPEPSSCTIFAINILNLNLCNHLALLLCHYVYAIQIEQ
jgi:hypothetical protein